MVITDIELVGLLVIDCMHSYMWMSLVYTKRSKIEKGIDQTGLIKYKASESCWSMKILI